MYDKKGISNGIVAGVVAGIVFAFFLILGGMTETLGSLIGWPTKLGGLIVHFIVSIIAGIAFALILGWLIHSWWSAAFLGLLFGVAMWIAGPMTLLPSIAAGAPLFSKWNFAGIQANIPPLIGHLVYGLVLGLGYCFLKKGKLHKLKKPKL
ncbi:MULTISPECIES: hypothetical protein [Legionella]|uniref:Transmembrane protein n=1 Tax=Legionella maceachernii TaxID=466 RepID=A0A0W0WC02_9GAMM|nr:hypothetical protein [Legionella maceachernii]KTD29889.1 hypothetical protein Lmac_0711 [Legionella maceachernii]SJZ45098.1 hypothetical protein SAMN02745128_00048 [Legionella maceachernii]SUP04111.1 Uncharacterised protein [Legionella maceachernii]